MQLDSSSVSIDPLLSERQLCDWLGVGTATASRWRYEGTGPRFIQLGTRRLAYRKSEVERWLAERERDQGSLYEAGGAAVTSSGSFAA